MKKRSKIVLRQRDYTILKHIYEYRFLSGELILYLIKNDNYSDNVLYSIGSDGKNRPKTYGFKRQALYKRLKQLYDSGYVERHYITDLPLGRGYGSPRAIYGLGMSSPQVLNEIFQMPKYEVQKIVLSNKVKSPFLRHALELATFKIILELACKASKNGVSLQFWRQDETIRDFIYVSNESGSRMRFPICPDAFFRLSIESKVARQYFLEIDRGTEPIVSNFKRSSIRKKLIAYQAYYKSNKFFNRSGYTGRGFQVLIVTPGRITTQLSVSGRIANIYQEIVTNKEQYTSKSLFLLTTQESLSLENPQTIFSNIWVSSKSRSSLLRLIE